MIDWNILGIEPTTERMDIKRAYAKKVKEYHPEEDPKGFQYLRETYEQALKYAFNADKSAQINSIFEDDEEIIIDCVQNNNQKEEIFDTPSIRAEQIIKRFEELYNDKAKRNDENEWEKLLEDDVLWNYDVKQITASRLFHFLEGNHDMNYEILLFLNTFFEWSQEERELIHHFFSVEEIVAMTRKGGNASAEFETSKSPYDRVMPVKKSLRRLLFDLLYDFKEIVFAVIAIVTIFMLSTMYGIT